MNQTAAPEGAKPPSKGGNHVDPRGKAATVPGEHRRQSAIVIHLGDRSEPGDSHSASWRLAAIVRDKPQRECHLTRPVALSSSTIAIF